MSCVPWKGTVKQCIMRRWIAALITMWRKTNLRPLQQSNTVINRARTKTRRTQNYTKEGLILSFGFTLETKHLTSTRKKPFANYEINNTIKREEKCGFWRVSSLFNGQVCPKTNKSFFLKIYRKCPISWNTVPDKCQDTAARSTLHLHNLHYRVMPNTSKLK